MYLAPIYSIYIGRYVSYIPFHYIWWLEKLLILYTVYNFEYYVS